MGFIYFMASSGLVSGVGSWSISITGLHLFHQKPRDTSRAPVYICSQHDGGNYLNGHSARRSAPLGFACFYFMTSGGLVLGVKSWSMSVGFIYFRRSSPVVNKMQPCAMTLVDGGQAFQIKGRRSVFCVVRVCGVCSSGFMFLHFIASMSGASLF